LGKIFPPEKKLLDPDREGSVRYFVANGISSLEQSKS